MKRFKIGELVRFRPLECYGEIVAKEKREGKTWYKIKLRKNYEGKRITYSTGTTIEHIWE